MFGFPLKIFSRKHSKDISTVNQTLQDLGSLIDRGIRLLLIHAEGDEGLDYLHVILGNELYALMENKA